MTFTTYGGDGSLTEAVFARMMWSVMPDEVSGCEPTLPNGTRLVRIGDGAGWNGGVYFEHTAATAPALDVNGGGNPRIDLVVADTVWAGPGATTTLAVVKGTSDASPVAPSLIRNPGVRHQEAYAQVLVRSNVTQLLASDVTFVAPRRRLIRRLDFGSNTRPTGQGGNLGFTHTLGQKPVFATAEPINSALSMTWDRGETTDTLLRFTVRDATGALHAGQESIVFTYYAVA